MLISVDYANRDLMERKRFVCDFDFRLNNFQKLIVDDNITIIVSSKFLQVAQVSHDLRLKKVSYDLWFKKMICFKHVK